MPNSNNEIQWLQTKQTALLNDLTELESSSDDPLLKEALNKISELFQINQRMQALVTVSLLTEFKESEMEIDNQLMEIADYLESIFVSRQREAKNLNKLR